MLLLISTVKLVKDIHQQISASVTDRTMRNIVIPVVCSLALCCTTTKVKINKSVFSLGRRLSTGHCPHLLVNTVLRCCCCYPLISAASRALSSKPAACCCRSMRQTDTHPFHRPCSVNYADRVNKYRHLCSLQCHHCFNGRCSM